MMVDVAVVGGGVSGLSAAWALAGRGHRVVVLERQVAAGGNAISERIGGFLMEHGPSTVNALAEDAVTASTALGLDDLRRDLGPGVRRRYLVKGGALKGIDTHPLGFVTGAYLPLAARARVLAEVLVRRPPAGAGDETVAEFFARRFGRAFAEDIVDPLVAGLFAGRADDLSMAAVFPRLVAMERRHGSITAAMIRRRFGGGTMPGRRLFSWRDGVGTLPRALARRLGECLRTGVAVRRLRGGPDAIRIETARDGTILAKAVVIATQPHVAAALLDGLDAPAAEAAAAIAAPPLAVVFLGYRRAAVAHPLDGLGYLTPAREGRAINGALFPSTLFPHRAPSGHVAIASYVGGARAPDLALAPAAELVALARAEFADLLGARGEPVVARLRQWPLGLPQYRPGHGDLVAALRGLEQRVPGLFATGNYFAGPSIAACLAEAGETAARVDGHLRDRDKAPRVSSAKPIARPHPMSSRRRR